MAGPAAGGDVPRPRPRSALGFAEGRAVDPDGGALMAQAAEQGGDHVLVAEEVQPVIVVQVGRDSVESRVKLLVIDEAG